MYPYSSQSAGVATSQSAAPHEVQWKDRFVNTHSEVLECLHLVPKHDQLGPQGLDDILAEVSNRRPAQGLEPDKFKLKDELWIEYDPTFFHLSLQGPLFPSVICPRFPATLATPNPARSSS